ncbi:MAG TPA: thiamine pyrophosphate-binding protein [Xanthobacteraceae bacterium]|nr:thiamine pyrophosphate-binding protein [Xanthobacteraceae bacterium]
MKHLIKQYIDQGMSRRQLVSGLSALGMSGVAAKAVAQNLAPVAQSAAPNAAPAAIREVEGNGGKLFVEQLKAAGVEYIFFNPSTGDHPIFDAVVDTPEIKLIKGIQEGAVVAMADGYARASGRTGVVVVANIGLPNAMTQMVNTWKDQIPMLVAVASVDQNALGRDQFQETDHHELMTEPITKWFWQAQSAASMAETTRRGLKFASTPPCGPVFLSLPTNTLEQHAKAQVWERSKFDVPMRIRPDKEDIDKAARMLIEAKNPLVSVGDEITWCRGEKELLELVELLGAPAASTIGGLGFWSKPFPTRHPLYIGALLRTMRYPGKPDVLLNLGNKFGELASPGTQLISIRLDPTSLARGAPVDLGMVADLRLAMADLIASIKSMATATRLKEIADERAARTRAYSSQMAEARLAIARGLADSSPISMERLGIELEATLDRDTCYVADVDSGKTMDQVMSFGGADKQYFGTSPNVLGWGMAAGFGVKLARPDVPVVSVVGDGSFCFSGPQPLWSMARYRAPVTVIVLNNHSYNNERNRIWNSAGRQFETSRDMTCYNGDPDIDFSKAAGAFGVEGEVVKEPAGLKDAFARAKTATVEGRPYLLDIHIKREGLGAVSEWHPPYSLADLRTRKV